MLAGEWAVLEVGVPCVVAAIDKNVSVRLSKSNSDSISVWAPDLELKEKKAKFDGKQLLWKPELNSEEKEKLLIASHAIAITLQYLKAKAKKIRNFRIETGSEDCVVKLADGAIKKIGFGSSAAACVGIVRAILEFHEIKSRTKRELETVFKLACMAHFEAQGKVGSSFDVAASTFGGLLLYKRFDPKWLEDQAKAGNTVAQIVDAAWPSLQIESLEIPKNFQFLIGFTGPDSSTKEMIRKMNLAKETQKDKYERIIEDIQKTVEELVIAIQKNDPKKIISKLKEDRKALQALSRISGLELETQKLAVLADIAEQAGGSGKFSGSGGGGLGIGICFDEKTGEKIRQNWKKNGIEVVEAGIAKSVL